MNLVYLKYAVEVAEVGSINKAAERLYVDQSNLSRCIKDLESSLGVAVFERSARGVKLTADGKIFLDYAKKILSEIETVERMFKEGASNKKRFSLSCPRASYVSCAFASFSKQLAKNDDLEVYYKETNGMRTLRNVLQDDYRLGILRYSENYDRYYKTLFEERDLCSELVAEFRHVLLVGKDSPLAKKSNVTFEDLATLTEVAHADPYVPSLPLAEVQKEELSNMRRRIFVFERGSQFDILSQNPDTFMWVSPMPQSVLERYGLVCVDCCENRKTYKDVMIYRKDYHLTELDNAFVSELCRVKREVFE